MKSRASSKNNHRDEVEYTQNTAEDYSPKPSQSLSTVPAAAPSAHFTLPCKGIGKGAAPSRR